MEFYRNFILEKHPYTHGKSILMRFNFTLSGWMAALTCVIASQYTIAQTTLDIAMPPSQMAQNLVGPGVQILNVQVTAADSSFGYYTSTATELGTNQGLLLTTGKAEYAFGPNNSIGFCNDGFNPNLIPCDYFDNNFPGSALLSQSQDRQTFDATTFEFDIKPQGDSLKFKYIFASEEYMEWANSPFKDVFGFYITGPGIGTDVNIALIPGSNEIVSITNVNAVDNNAFYYNNQNPLGQFIQYDGFTINLVAKVGNLIPCETYHLKLIIADGSDRIFDSGVFIQAIESNPVAVVTATSNGLDYMVEGCNVGSIDFTRPEVTNQPQTIQYWVGGSATSGVDYEPSLGSADPFFPSSITIPANESSVSLTLSALVDNMVEGQEYITIYLENPLCTGTEVLDSVNFYIYDLLEVSLNASSNAICFGQCVTLTGTSIAENLGTVSWSPLVPLPNALVNEVCPTETTTYTLTGEVGDCVASAEVTILVSNIDINLIATNSSCAGNGTGSISVEPIGALAPLTYAWTGPDGFTSADSTLNGLEPGEYCVVVTDAAGCIAEDCATIILIAPLSASATLSNYSCAPISCYGSCDGSVTVTVTGGQAPFAYAWTGVDFISAAANPIGLCAGDYSLVVTDFNGCETSLQVSLTEPEPVSLNVVGTEDLLCTGIETGSITVSADGGCPFYTYSWSHNPSLTGPIASNLASGTYTVNVQDQNGCSSVGSAIIEINEPIAPLTVVVDAISTFSNGLNTTCPGSTDGSIDISISGGSPNYTITWTDGSDDLVANTEDLVDVACGDYNLVVEDANGCLFTQSINITCVPEIEITYDAEPNPCGAPEVSAGSIQILTTIGGNGGPYNYDWSGPSCPCTGTNLVNLNSGDYTVTVTDSQGCSNVFTINVGENDAFDVEFITSNNTCNGSCDGEIDITVTDNGGGGGGTPFPLGMIINANTEINVCYSGFHTWVSDLEYHLVGPAGCGSPNIILSAQPGTNCNSGDNFSSLCFSSESSLNFNVCSATAPLTGTFGSTGVTPTPINWSSFYGCDAAEPGWKLEIWDCISGDGGVMIDANINFNGINNSNQNTSINYLGPNGITGSIGPLTCGSGITATFTAQGIPGWYAGLQGGGGGNSGTYTFDWSGPFEGPVPTTEDVSGLCAGDYSVTISSGDCMQSFDFTITEPVAIEIEVVEANNPICFGQNDGSIDINILNGSGDYTYNWLPSNCFPPFNGASTQDISNLNACTYTVEVIDNVSGCTASVTITLTAPEVMTLTLEPTEYGTGDYFTSCSNANDGSIQVYVSGGTPDPIGFAPYQYLFDWITDCSEVDPAGYGNNPNADFVTNLPGGSYGLNVYDANGCLATTCIDLLPPPPLASDPIVTNIDCNNPTGSITPNITGGPSGYILVWTGDIGTNNPNAPTLVDLEAGTYTLYVTADIGTACVDTFTYVIDETTAPTITIVEQSNVICNESCDAEIVFDITGGLNPYSVTLNGQAVDASSLPITVQDLCIGTYDILVIDEAGCSVSTTVLIDGPELLEATITSLIQDPNQPYDIQCYGDSVGSLVANATGGTGIYTYEWTNEANEVISSNAQVNNLAAGTYCVAITDESGCTTNACYTLTQPDQPLSATYITSIYHDIYEVSCPDATDGAIDLTVTGGTPGYTYNWQGDGVDPSSEDQTELGVGLYEVLVVDSNSCTITLSITLSAPDPVLIGATLSQFDGGYNVSCFEVCDGSIDANIVSQFGNYALTWSGPDGYVSTDEDISNLCAGDYTINILDSLGCNYSNSFALIEPALLEGTINTSLDCTTGAAQLCVTVSGGSGNYSYLWETGTAIGCIDVTEDGNYCVDITDSNGCAAQVCADADPSAPYNGSIVTTTDATCGLCNGAIDISVTGGTGTYDFDWSGAVTDPTDEDQTDLCEGNYSVVITDGNDCTITLSSSIEAGSLIDLIVSATNVACFGGSTGSISAQIANATLPLDVQWTDANNNPISDTLSVTELPAGTYIFSYIDAAGCADSEPVTITENGALDIEATLSLFGEYNISEADGTDGSIAVTVTGGTSPYEYQWSPAVGTTTENEVSGLIAGNYSLVVVDENGCEIDTVFSLTEPESLGLPTGLSPNGDGLNDFYVIPGVLKCEASDFKVFNRWGNVVFESTDYHNEWYGQSKDGGILADGTYFVIFTCDAEEFNTYVDLRRE
jgi:gliding motility-associated-like protein